MWIAKYFLGFTDPYSETPSIFFSLLVHSTLIFLQFLLPFIPFSFVLPKSFSSFRYEVKLDQYSRR
jgi:hypothetical protein